MLPEARWWYERLRTMSLAEVAHRSVRLARYPIDLAVARYGRPSRATQARLARWRGPEVFMFSEATARAPLPPSVRRAAEAHLAGRQTVLGLGELALPDEPWHLEPRAGGRWPLLDAGRVVAAAPADFDPRTTWELNRGHGWVVLARAHAATRDPRFRDRLIAELRGWRAANPIGFGINWVSAMEAAIRCHALTWVAALLRGDAAVPWPLLATLLHDHAAFVARHLSRFSSANNHLIVELTGLVVAGRALGAPNEHALDELAREAERQTFADGVNVEMATHYHMFVLEALLLVAWLERAHGQPAHAIEQVIARMADYLDAITLRSGDVLAHGDNDDGMIVPLLAPRHAEQLLSAARALVGGPPDPAPGDGARLLCDGAPALRARPAPRSRRFVDAGQIVLRGARLHATLDAGPFGFGPLAAHAHCDALAIHVAFDDQPLVVERGTYRYNGDRAARDRYRSTAAHNTVQVGSREQADATGAFLWSRQPVTVIERCTLGADDVVRASHDGFAPVRHTRTLTRLDDTLVIVDEAQGAAVARWHLAPDATLVELAGGWAIVRDASGAERWLWFDAAPRAITTPHSARYLAEQPACTLEVALVRGRLVTVLGADARDREAELQRVRARAL